MTLEEAILEKVRAMPADKQKAILDIVTELSGDAGPMPKLIDPRGMWKKYDISISVEDIAEARREIWGNFPRDDF